jgi:hypothetical protein
MKHILLALLLTVVTTAHAFPTWTMVKDNNIATAYININTIPDHAMVVTIWLLVDFKKQQGKWWSSTIQEKYDCEHRLQKTLTVTVFTEHMGRGDSHLMVLPPNLMKWHRFVPDSDAENIWHIACNK